MRIVLAVDETAGSKLGLAVLDKLPLAPGARITVATVVHSGVPVEMLVGVGPIGYAPVDGSDAWRNIREGARSLVDSAAENWKQKGLDTHQAVLEGDVADELLKLVRAEGAELIVSGSGESSDFSAFFLGSVSRKLALNSEASVLIGRSYEGKSHLESIEILRSRPKLRALVAIDGSIGSEMAIDTLRAIREPAFDTVSVLAVEPISDQIDEDRFSRRTPQLEPDAKWTEALVRQTAQEIRRCADHVEWLTAFGRPSVEIARVAKLRQKDLVLLAANRHGPLERWLLGSCAYEVATSAPCSVLIVRQPLRFTPGGDD